MRFVTLLAVIPLVLVVSASGCLRAGAEASDASPRAGERVTGAQAKRLVAAGGLLLDVRSTEEFAASHLDGARNVPLDQVEESLGTIPKGQPVVVYCQSGARAAVAAKRLAAAGYDVHDLGGIANWNR